MTDSKKYIVLRALSRLAVIMAVLVVSGCYSNEKEPSEQADKSTKYTLSLPKSAKESPAIFESLSPAKAHKMLSSRKDILSVDVRSAKEIAEVAIEGTKSIPMRQILGGEYVLPKDKAILLMCAVGMRSYGVGRFLVHEGYPEVYNLSGGIVAWEKEGLAVVKNNRNREK